MSKIDCSNVFNFAKEWKRREVYERKQGKLKHCPLEEFGKRDGFADKRCLEQAVTGLQKWSDAHQQITRKEKFIKICNENGIEKVIEQLREDKNESKFMDGCITCTPLTCEECKAWWNEAIDE